MVAMLKTTAAALAALATLGLGVAGSAAVSSTGLRGVVSRSPISPVCTAEDSCSAPAPHTQVAFFRSGARVTTRTDGSGRYRVILAPGWWRVRATPARMGTAISPERVRVFGKRIRIVDFDIDTGIR